MIFSLCDIKVSTELLVNLIERADSVSLCIFSVVILVAQLTHYHISLVDQHASSNQILDLLIPEEETDLSDLVLEVTAGVGGQEAMLFTAEVRKYICVLVILN